MAIVDGYSRTSTGRGECICTWTEGLSVLLESPLQLFPFGLFLLRTPCTLGQGTTTDVEGSSSIPCSPSSPPRSFVPRRVILSDDPFSDASPLARPADSTRSALPTSQLTRDDVRDVLVRPNRSPSLHQEPPMPVDRDKPLPKPRKSAPRKKSSGFDVIDRLDYSNIAGARSRAQYRFVLAFFTPLHVRISPRRSL
jgi:hypothetical protein